MAESAFNIKVPDLPDGYTPLEVVAIVKSLDEEGDPVITIRTSDGIMEWEAVGMLIAAGDMARADLRESFQAMEDDEPSGPDDE